MKKFFILLAIVLIPLNIKGVSATIDIDYFSEINGFNYKYLYGNNTAIWIDPANYDAVKNKIIDMSGYFLRFPGGSFSDKYHWNGTGYYDSNDLWVPDNTNWSKGFTCKLKYDDTNLIDGDTNTEWRSVTETSTAYFWIRLDASYNVDTIKITWGTPYATNYEIQYWNSSSYNWAPHESDTNYWVTIKTVTGATGGIDTQTFSSVNARVFRILMTQSSSQGYSVKEVEIFNGATQYTPTDVAASPTNRANEFDANFWKGDFDTFMTFMQSLGPEAEPLIIVNFGSGTPEEAADWVYYANIVKGYNIKYWEIGNEMGGAWEVGGPVDAEYYAKRFIQYAEAMKSVDSSIKICAPAMGLDDADELYDGKKYLEKILEVLQANGKLDLLDIITHHEYPTWNNTDPQVSLQTPSKWDTWKSYLDNLLTTYYGSPDAKEILTTEYNSGSATEEVTMQVANAIWVINWLGEFIKNFGYRAKAMLWDILNGSISAGEGEHACFENGNLPSPYTFQERPDYWALFMMNKYFSVEDETGNTLVASTTDQTPLVTYANKRSDGKLSLVVLNKSDTDTYNAVININNFPVSNTADVYTFSGNTVNPYYIQNWVWHGSFNPPYADPDLPPYYTQITFAANSFNFDFPPYSITIFNFLPINATPTLTHTITPTLTITLTPTITPTLNPIFNTCDTIDYNGTWSGDSAVRSINTTNSNAITEGSGSLYVNITSTANWQDDFANLSNFTPQDFGNYEGLSMDIYIPAGSEPWDINSSWHNIILYVDSASTGKWYRRLSSSVSLNTGINNITFTFDWTLDTNQDPILPADPISKIILILNTQTGKTGEVYIDNMRLIPKQPTPTQTTTFTQVFTNTNTLTPTYTITITPTITYTLAETPTLTITYTYSFTNTQIHTITLTATNTSYYTPTNTLTNTLTYTETQTATNTPYYTPTNTLTNTSTYTETQTATNTPQFTITNTFTNTPFETSTSTQLFTSTITPTFTLTMPFTETFTPTDTFTNTFLPTNTFTFTDTVIYTPSPTNTMTMFDDFEDNDFSKNNWGGDWTLYSSQNSIAANSITTDAADGNYAGYLYGDLLVDLWASIGLSSYLKPDGTPFDLRSYTGIRLKMKGKIGTGTETGFYIRLISNNITDYSYWRYSFTPLSNWTQYTILWSEFQPPSWGEGKTKTLDEVLANTVAIDFLITDLTGGTPDSKGNELYIDSIDFFVFTPTPTFTITLTHTLTLTPPPGSTSTFTPTETPDINACGLRIVAYYWPGVSGCDSNSLPYNKLTHIIHSFIYPQADGSLVLGNGVPDNTLITNAHNNGVKVYISTGGGGSGSDYYDDMALNPDARANFVNNIYNFILTNNYDGIDIDWEFPDTEEEKQALNNLVKELREKFDSSPYPAPSWGISIAVGGTDNIEKWKDYGFLNNYVNFYNLMSYAMHGKWDDHAGHNAPLYKGNDIYDNRSCETYMNYLINERAVPSGLINMGIPFYGDRYPSVENILDSCNGQCTGAYEDDYRNIYPLINNGWAYNYDSSSHVPYLTYDYGLGVISYDDEESIKEKIDYAINSRNAGGVFMWHLCGDFLGPDNQPLMDAMYNRILYWCERVTPTDTLSIIYSPTPTPTIGIIGVIDDFEDGELLKNTRKGDWNYWASDSSISYSITSGIEGSYALEVSGNVTGDNWPSLSFSTFLNSNKTSEDLNIADGLRLYMKGNKGTGTDVTFYIMLINPYITDYSYYRYTWEPVSNWTQYTLDWSSFSAPSWGQGSTYLKDEYLKNIDSISFVIASNLENGNNNTGNLWDVDYIEIYGVYPTETETPYFTPTPSTNELKFITDNPVIIYPNPAHKNIKLKFYINGQANLLNIKIYTVAGRLIKNIKVKGNYSQKENIVEIKPEYIQNLASGVYYYVVELENEKEKIKSKVNKFIVLR